MKKILFLSLFITFISLCSFQNVFAIGMMTQPIVVKDILRGQETMVTLNLLNSEKKEVTYGLKGEGQVASWVNFYNIEDKDLKTPIKEIIKLKTSFIPSTYNVGQGKPLSIRVLYANEGNVTVKPELHLKVSKKEGATVYNVIFPYPDDQETVRAYAQKEIPAVEWQTTGQDMGNYTAEMKVFLNGSEMQTESFDFSIGNANLGALAALSLFGSNTMMLVWLGIGAVVAAGIFIILKKGIKFSF